MTKWPLTCGVVPVTPVFMDVVSSVGMCVVKEINILIIVRTHHLYKNNKILINILLSFECIYLINSDYQEKFSINCTVLLCKFYIKFQYSANLTFTYKVFHIFIKLVHIQVEPTCPIVIIHSTGDVSFRLAVNLKSWNKILHATCTGSLLNYWYFVGRFSLKRVPHVTSTLTKWWGQNFLTIPSSLWKELKINRTCL